jgi:hypothetical protein
MQQDFENNFERFLRDAVDDQRMYPPGRVWNGIYDRVHGKKRMFAIAFLSLGLLLALFIFRDSRQSSLPGPLADNKGPVQSGKTKQPETPAIPLIKTAKTPAVSTAAPSGIINTPLFYEQVAVTTPAGEPSAADLYEDQEPENNNSGSGSITSAYAPYGKTPVTTIETMPGVIDNFPRLDIASGLIKEHFPENEMTPLNNDRHDRKAAATKTEPKLQMAKVAVPAKVAGKRVSFGYYIAPGISYRSLYNTRSSKGSGDSADLDKAVRHKPGMGMEAGIAWRVQIDRRLQFKAGLQLNYNHYNIKASVAPARTTTNIELTNGNGQLMVPASYENRSDGIIPRWLENKNLQLSIPIGMEFEVSGNDRAQLNIGATVQPSYLIRDKSYLLSTDKKTYTSEADLKLWNKEDFFVRRFNMNAAIEAFISFNTGKNTRWHIGPQLRYQLFSSYNKAYPFKENLIDYNFKLGFSKIIR